MVGLWRFYARPEIRTAELHCITQSKTTRVKHTMSASDSAAPGDDVNATAALRGVAEAAAEVSPEMTLPSSILPMPSSLTSSLSSWWNLSTKQTAEAEFYLMSKSGFFEGATLGNARACTTDGPDALAEAYELAQKDSQPTEPFDKQNQFMTVGVEPGAEGRVGCIRLVDIGPPPPGSSRAGLLNSMGMCRTKRLVNTLEIGTPVRAEDQPKDEQKIVLVHGYAAGSAFFFKNLGMFGSQPNTRFFALDWLGMGRSSRPPYALPRTNARSAERVEAAENFFLTSLEQWREKMKIEKMVLVGHSLGGYLSMAYALKHPERVEKLVLVSPVGIPEGSWDIHAGEEQAKRNAEQPKSPEPERSPSPASVSSNTSTHAQPPRRFGNRMLGVLGWLWDHNVSIFGIIRSTSFFGPLLISGYTRNRFGNIAPDELLCMHAYCHGVFSGRGSSEYCCTYLC